MTKCFLFVKLSRYPHNAALKGDSVDEGIHVQTSLSCNFDQLLEDLWNSALNVDSVPSSIRDLSSWIALSVLMNGKRKFPHLQISLKKFRNRTVCMWEMYKSRFHHLLTNTLKKPHSHFGKFIPVSKCAVKFSSSKSRNVVTEKRKIGKFLQNYSDFVEWCNRACWYLSSNHLLMFSFLWNMIPISINLIFLIVVESAMQCKSQIQEISL